MSTAERTWVPGAAGSGFDVDNLPYGVGRRPGTAAGVVVRIGDAVLEAGRLAAAEGHPLARLLTTDLLNPLMSAGSGTWDDVRAWVTTALTDPVRERWVRPFVVPLADVELSLPFAVGDFVDFYASEHHATNVGRMLRPDGAALLPNWRHLPVGYHGRAGSVVVSGTPVRRPVGQRLPRGEDAPVVGPTRRLDLEAELGFVVGPGLERGARATTADLDDLVFGVVGLNDWSARDVQAWEAVPLGPHLSKSFATSVSAWVTPLVALSAARTVLRPQDPPVLDYLRQDPLVGFDVDVEVEIGGEVVARPPFSAMYWTPAQMLAHLTVGGASLRTGDLFASGTISGPRRGQRGCLLELSWGGTEPFLVAGRERTFLEDGDEVVLRYSAPGTLGRVSLGEVRGTVEPADGA